MTLKIGDTLYHFDYNRRKYTAPEPGSMWGKIIYAEHFQPLKIVEESKQSWLMEYGHKAAKKDPRAKGYFTAAQMADDIWAKENRLHIVDLLERADVGLLRQAAELLGYRGDGQHVRPTD